VRFEFRRGEVYCVKVWDISPLFSNHLNIQLFIGIKNDNLTNEERIELNDLRAEYKRLKSKINKK
jgi:hypothetical protein